MYYIHHYQKPSCWICWHWLKSLITSFNRSICMISVSPNWKNFSCNHTDDTVAGRKLEKISVAFKLSSLNFNPSVRTERSFAICYLNVVIKSLRGNLDICLNYHANAYFQLRNSVRVISVADRDRKWEMLFWIAPFGRTPEQFSRCCDRNPFQSWKNRSCECTYWSLIGHATQSWELGRYDGLCGNTAVS